MGFNSGFKGLKGNLRNSLDVRESGVQEPLKIIDRLPGLITTVLNSVCSYPSSLILPPFITEHVDIFLPSLL
jgi:hypothetical protein